jgi:hypothetical protein
MFQIAVLGPQFADRLGIVRQCIECRAAAGVNAAPCPGYGPGCLMTPRPARDEIGECRACPFAIPTEGLSAVERGCFGGCSAFMDTASMSTRRSAEPGQRAFCPG